MPDLPADIGSEFDRNLAGYGRLREEILFNLEKALSAAGIKTHSIACRVKGRESFLQKSERKGYTDPFGQTTDLVGARVVCLFLDDLEKVEGVLRSVFDVGPREDTIDGGPVESFGYMSHHYVCRLHQSHAGPRYDDIRHLPFEIQVRTIVQDAWANISHHLAYKGERSIPDELKRDFHALSGLFYIADQHFQLFSVASDRADRAAVHKTATPDLDNSPLNRARARALLKELYPDRKRALVSSISEFVEEAATAGFTTVGDMRELLVSTRDVFEEYEAENPPGPRTDARVSKRFADVGASRLSMAIASKKYAETRGDAAEFDEWRSKLAAR